MFWLDQEYNAKGGLGSLGSSTADKAPCKEGDKGGAGDIVEEDGKGAGEEEDGKGASIPTRHYEAAECEVVLHTWPDATLREVNLGEGGREAGREKKKEGDIT